MQFLDQEEATIRKVYVEDCLVWSSHGERSGRLKYFLAEIMII